jgi:tetratricopeptide (TPR) repeat protein
MQTTIAIVSACISAAALLISTATFFWNKRKHNVEAQSAARSQLTNLIFELTNISVAFEQLRAAPAHADPNIVNMRRVLNSRRSFIVEYAERCIEKIDPVQVSSTELQIMAIACDGAGFMEKTEKYWNLAVERSATPESKVYHLRGFARFLFRQGKSELARDHYMQAITVPRAASDQQKYTNVETYIMWASVEKEFGYTEEARRQIQIAANEVQRLQHEPSRSELNRRIATFVEQL